MQGKQKISERTGSLETAAAAPLWLRLAEHHAAELPARNGGSLPADSSGTLSQVLATADHRTPGTRQSVRSSLLQKRMPSSVLHSAAGPELALSAVKDSIPLSADPCLTASHTDCTSTLIIGAPQTSLNSGEPLTRPCMRSMKAPTVSCGGTSR